MLTIALAQPPAVGRVEDGLPWAERFIAEAALRPTGGVAGGSRGSTPPLCVRQAGPSDPSVDALWASA